MTPQSSHIVPLAIVAGALLLTSAACGGDAGQAPSPTSPAGATGSAAPASAAASTAPTSAASSSAPSGPGSSSPATGGSGGSACAVGSLEITYADDAGGGGAGSVQGTLTFANTGSAACTLTGFPGVSFVGGGNGTQVGAAATRTDDTVRTRTLAPGKAVRAALRRTQPGNYGDACQQAKVDGFRVYPPDSTESAFVAFPANGCRSTSAPLLQVGPVR